MLLNTIERLKQNAGPSVQRSDCIVLPCYTSPSPPPPPPPPSLLMSGQADRLWLRAQVNNLKKNPQWKSGSSSPHIETHTVTHTHSEHQHGGVLL